MLATNAGLLTPVLGDPSPWTPQRLYTNGEAGLYYEPADLTAEKVAWRRNLLTWSEQFDNAAWEKIASSITADATAAPNGTTTADKLIESATTGLHLARQVFASNAGLTYTVSVYAKASERSLLAISGNLAGLIGAAYYDLSNGLTVNVAAGTTASIENVGNGWYRCAWTRTATSSASVYVGLYLATTSSNALTGYAGDGTSGAFIWGAQLELGTTASAYQRITDFTSDFLAAFPTHALYQDAAGTTPVTALGQPVGLALDRSRGGLANLGPELFSNSTFAANTTGWQAAGSATVTWNAGAAEVDITGAGGGIEDAQTLALTVGATYLLKVRLRTGTYTSAVNFVVGGADVRQVTPAASYITFQVAFVAAAADPTVIVRRGAVATGTIFVDEISLQLVPGVHAIQPTSASRPALDARVNLLTHSEQFDNAAWTKGQGGVALAPVVTANAGVAPDGTTTADRIVFDLNGGTTSSDLSQLQQGPTLVSSIYRSSVWLRTEDNSTKVFSLVGPFGAAQAISVTGTWTQFAVVDASAGTGAFRLRLRGGEGTAASATVLAWGADLRLATDAAYPYQRVVTATDYADVGVPRSFLFDGFDDSLYTASTLNLSATDKVTVWAGVYKNSDAARGIVMELGPASAINGIFLLNAPSASLNDFVFQSGGTIAAPAGSSGSAPISRVVTGIGNIGAPSVTLRLNGVQVAQDTTTQGTGNYQNGVLFIGRRNNASLPLNGKLYIPVVRGAQTDAATLALTERYVGSRMGIVL